MKYITVNTTKIKQLNVQMVRDCLKKLEYGTKASISQITGLGISTCGNILNELIEDGEVIECDLDTPNGGRPARRFIYNSEFLNCLCIYVHTTDGIKTICYTVTDALGKIKESHTKIMEYIDYQVLENVIQGQIDRYEKIKTIALSFPGVIGDKQIIECDIIELVGENIVDKLKNKFNIDIQIGNDMNYKAYGFYKNMQFDMNTNIAYITFPAKNCPGCGMIVNGEILKGNTRFSGEILYLPYQISREKVMEYIHDYEGLIFIAVQIICSIVVILNPKVIALTGSLLKQDQINKIIEKCEQIVPKEHMPQIVYRKNNEDDYIRGLTEATLDQLNKNLIIK